MASKWTVSNFDLRPVDFSTGKRIAISRDQMIQCDCCNRWISRGAKLTTGERVGTECARVGEYFKYDDSVSTGMMKVQGMSKRQAEFFGLEVIGN